METWTGLLNILILLGAAIVFGLLAERFRQSALVGYIIAGMLVGPNVLGLVGSREQVEFIAELGVTLLLFSIGIEFSYRRLLRIGKVTYIGGTAQIAATVLAGFAAARLFGLGPRPSLAVGMMVSLSSTAVVMRTLLDEARLDSVYGRNGLGILLIQDLAVVPMVLATIALGGGSPVDSLMLLGRALLFGLLLLVLFYLVFNRLLPRFLRLRSWSRNRDVPVLVAAVAALGSAWSAQQVGISPAFGAFLAGMLLAESPFATQIRADVAPLSTLLVTLFFAAIGLLVDPRWIAANIIYIIPVPLLLAVVKPTVIFLVIRRLGYPAAMSLATGICLFQIGEFSFVLAEMAHSSGVIGFYLFRYMTSSIVLSLLFSPWLIRNAPRIAGAICRLPLFARRTAGGPVASAAPAPGAAEPPARRILIIGFGPAGRQVAESLLPERGGDLQVLDVNPSNAGWAQSLDLPFRIGDAGRREVLEHAGIREAEAVVIALPDPVAVRHIIRLCKELSPQVRIFARARYHIYGWEFIMDGAEGVVDEEVEVGRKLAAEVLEKLGEE